MEDCKYYNDDIRCYRDGVVERINKQRPKNGWCVVKNTANHCDGYNRIGINGKMIKRHRIIAYCFLGLEDIVGKLDKSNVIDHINGNKLDNRVENLRITTQQGNTQNKLNVKGFSWDKAHNKWQATIKVNNKKTHLGYYDTQEEARQSYLNAKPLYHKFMVH